MFNFDKRIYKIIGIEVGMKNSGLSVAFAVKYFSAAAALPAAIFSIWYNLSGSMMAAYWRFIDSWKTKRTMNSKLIRFKRVNILKMTRVLLILILFLPNIMSGVITNMGIKKNNDGTFSIVSKNLELIFSPQIGGRITSFKLDGKEFLSQKDIHELNYGSTLWPSPQSLWKWPPLKTLDCNSYTIGTDSSSIIITSDIDSKTGLCFSKIIKEPLKQNSIELPFIITNKCDTVISVSPWQITRVGKGGILFFPIGDGGQKPKYFDMAPTHEIERVVWYKSQKDESLKNNQLNTADGAEGWIAYAIDKMLFVKKFKDIKPAQFAPEEAEILFYVSAEYNYIEIEVQGPYQKLSNGESMEWTIEWFAYEIPPDIKVEIGSKELIAFVRNKIK